MATGIKERRSFILYESYGDQIDKLSDEAAGQLIKAIFAHVNGKPIPEIKDSGADMAFSFIRAQLDRDKEAYEQKCEKNRSNGSKGGRPPKNQTVIEKPNGLQENRTVTEETEEEAPEPKKPTKILQEIRFEEFWKLYPKKTGKQAALKSWLRIRPDAELFEKIIRAVTAARETEQWKIEGGRFIPNPATWLNQGRWDDEPIQAEQRQDPTARRRDPMKNPFI